jgi:pimeloyl-ACP methyl ester carboxylesterase
VPSQVKNQDPTFSAGLIDRVDLSVEGSAGPVILMLHGWPDTRALWNDQVAELRGRFRCVRITLPGFEPGSGRQATSLEAMLMLLDRIVDLVSPDEPIVLLLHDWGCFFGYQYAMLRPDRIHRVIGIDIGDAGSPMYAASLTVSAKAMTAGYQLWLAAAWRLGGSVGNAMTRAMARAIKAPSPELAHAGMNYPYDIAWTGSHGSYRGARQVELACPLLFIFGSRKSFMFHSPTWAAQLAENSGCEVVAVEAGHWVMKDDPGTVNSAIGRFLDSTRA